MKHPYLLMIVLGVSGFLATCSTKSDGIPGTCKLSCGGAMIAPNDYIIQKRSADATIRCGMVANGADTKTVKISARFGIFKKQVLGDGPERLVPVPNVSIRPEITGVLDEAVGQEPFIGVVTNHDSFCTDSCGGVTIEVAAKCPSKDTTEVAIGISSGSLANPDESVLVKLQAPDADYANAQTGNSTDTTAANSAGLLLESDETEEVEE